MNGKSIPFIIISLLISSAFIPITLGFNVKVSKVRQPSILSNGKTLYVGGSGPDNYTMIQYAINDAVDGDTVFVYDESSPYYENVIVDKSISLIGENKLTTFINARRDGSVISIFSDWVYISGFTIQNCGRIHPNAGIYVNEVSHTFIVDNIISDNNYYGILLSKSLFSNISKNLITENNDIGIYDIGEHGIGNNTITWNIITYNYVGIRMDHSAYNIVTNNSIVYNKQYGIFAEGAHDLLFHHNDVINPYLNAFSNSKDNSWDNGYPLGGNYWSDYDGIDNYHGPNQDIPGSDGIGDTPYTNFYEWERKDHYPLMSPCLGFYADPNDSGLYKGEIDEMISFIGTAHGGIPPYNYHWDFGDGTTSDEQNPVHAYNAAGFYRAELTVTDINDIGSNSYATVRISHPAHSYLWADDDYNESTSGWGYDHFDSVHKAVEVSGESGTVFVYNGYYYSNSGGYPIGYSPKDISDNIVIDKTLILYGENKETTIIDGQGYGSIFRVISDNVVIESFTLQNADCWLAVGILVSSSTSGHTFSNNIIRNLDYGIFLGGSDKNIIYGNSIVECEMAALWLDTSDYNNIYRNEIANNEWRGICIFMGYSNRIYENNFINNPSNVDWADTLSKYIRYPLLRTKWSRNYWGRPLLGPKLILGLLAWIIGEDPYFWIIPFPWFQFDWFPAKEPYDIGI